MIENERLRVQLKAEEDRGRRDLEEVKREKERLEEKVRRGQHGEQEMREQLRLREIKIEETFESIKRLYERNN
jgi:predicted  nucleic acid-binding Zn-ribbon protein